MFFFNEISSTDLFKSGSIIYNLPGGLLRMPELNCRGVLDTNFWEVFEVIRGFLVGES